MFKQEQLFFISIIYFQHCVHNCFPLGFKYRLLFLIIHIYILFNNRNCSINIIIALCFYYSDFILIHFITKLILKFWFHSINMTHKYIKHISVFFSIIITFKLVLKLSLSKLWLFFKPFMYSFFITAVNFVLTFEIFYCFDDTTF